MKVFFNIILVILVLLAVASGATKILLMPQEVEFFGKYGFTNLILIAFGVMQLVGGIFLAFAVTRVVGALLVGVTFLVSAVVLGIAGNILNALLTLVLIVLLAFIIRQSIRGKNVNSNAKST